MTVKGRRPAFRPGVRTGAAAQLFWALTFLVFDHEARRPRPQVVGGLVALISVLLSHELLSGPWLHDAGLTLGRPHAQHAAQSPANTPADWRPPTRR